jgi:hypothetical protein
MSDPFREQRYSPAEVRDFLSRALRLAADDAETGEGRSLTRDEVERLAADLGLSAAAVRRAWEPEGEAPVKRFAVRGFLGAPRKLLYEIELEGEPSDDDREDLLDLIRSVTGETGQMQAIGKSLTWQTTMAQGRGRQLWVRLRSRPGRTRVVVEESLSPLSTGLFVGLGVGGGVGPLGGYIAAIAKMGVIGLLVPLVWIPLLLLLARSIYVHLARKREAQLMDLFARIQQSARAWRRPEKPRLRVAAEASRPEADEEAAEEEAAAAERARAR